MKARAALALKAGAPWLSTKSKSQGQKPEKSGSNGRQGVCHTDAFHLIG